VKVDFGRRGHLGDLLSGLLDGELTQRAVEAAQAHLSVCPACLHELEDVGAARAWVRGLPVVEPPAGFYERVLRDEPPEETPVVARFPGVGGIGFGAPSLRRKVLAFAGSAAAAVALLAVAAPQQDPVSPPVNRLVEAHATGASLGSDPLSRLAPLGVPVTFRK